MTLYNCLWNPHHSSRLLCTPNGWKGTKQRRRKPWDTALNGFKSWRRHVPQKTLTGVEWCLCTSHTPGRYISSWILFTWEHGLIFLSSCHILSVHTKTRPKSFTRNYHICAHYIPSVQSLQHYGGCKCTETAFTLQTIFPARHGSIHLKS